MKGFEIELEDVNSIEDLRGADIMKTFYKLIKKVKQLEKEVEELKPDLS